MEDPILSEFEDLIALQDDAAAAPPAAADFLYNGNDANQDDSFSQLKPMDASTLNAHELDQEMRRRGKVPKGFRSDDEKVLQIEFDQEHEEYLERVKKERMETRERARKQALMQHRRLLLEKQLKEEQDEAMRDHRIVFWLSLLRENATSSAARIEVSSISARAVAKAMWDNTSLLSLDLSRCGIDDISGAYLGRMLKHNNTLLKLEMGSNRLGPKTCSSLADALGINTTLLHLDLQANPLTIQGDNSGFAAFCEMLKNNNTTIIHLNLWRCQIGEQGGRELVQVFELNRTLRVLEIGYNDFRMDSQLRIAAGLDANLARFQQMVEVCYKAGQQRVRQEEELRQAAERKKKDEGYHQWLEEEKRLRLQRQCQAKLEAAEDERAAEIRADYLEAERKAAEKKAKEEAEAKKKKKEAAKKNK